MYLRPRAEEVDVMVYVDGGDNKLDQWEVIH